MREQVCSDAASMRCCPSWGRKTTKQHPTQASTPPPSPPPTPPPSPGTAVSSDDYDGDTIDDTDADYANDFSWPPTPPPTPPANPNACLYGKPGACINTDTHVCVGGVVQSGFCPGASNMKCCSTSNAKVKPATTAPTPQPTQPQPTTPGSNDITDYDYGDDFNGSDTDNDIDDYANNGNDNTVPPPPTQTLAPPSGSNECLHGQAGICIDATTHNCSGLVSA